MAAAMATPWWTSWGFFTTRISKKRVDETVQEKGELVAAGRYSCWRRIRSDIDMRNVVVLGRGAMGKVFLATWLGGGYRCAVKTLRKKQFSKSDQALLINEVGLYLSLDHPHIAKLEQVYESRKKIHFVMEHLQGGELLVRLQKTGRFAEEQAADSMRQMLLAVAYLHAHWICHRDLKPENFVFDKVDSNHLKMIDFGFACRFEEGTRMVQPCGTLHYMAPEVLARSYTERVDVWSMGAVAYVVLCGRSPWHPYRNSRSETLRRVAAGDVYYCPERFARLSAGSQEYVRSLLTVDPSARPSASSALQHDFIQSLAAPSAELDQEILQRLRRVERVPPLRRLCLSMAARRLPSRETTELRQQFEALDVMNHGSLRLDSFKRLIDEDDDLDADSLDSLFSNVDLGNDGEIGFNSFVVASMEQRPHEEVLRYVFSRLDADKSGAITARDLSSVLGAPTFEGATMEDLIREVDPDGVEISWQAFSEYLLRNPQNGVQQTTSGIGEQRACPLAQRMCWSR